MFATPSLVSPRWPRSHGSQRNDSLAFINAHVSMKTILTVPSRPITLSTLCALLLSAVCSAGNTGKIAGKVSDKATGELLVGASVIIKDMKIGAATDENGDYFILNVPPGTYTVTVMMIGYETIQRTGVEVVVDRTTQQSFVLQAGGVRGGEGLF